MSRTDGKRHDGLTLIPRQRGKSLAWDVTVVNTFSDSYISAAPLSQASVAEMAAERKISKYATCLQTSSFSKLPLRSWVRSINLESILFLKLVAD